MKEVEKQSLTNLNPTLSPFSDDRGYDPEVYNYRFD